MRLHPPISALPLSPSFSRDAQAAAAERDPATQAPPLLPFGQLVAFHLQDILPPPPDVVPQGFARQAGLLDPIDPQSLKPKLLGPLPAPRLLAQQAALQTPEPIPLPPVVDSAGMTDQDYLRIVRPDLVAANPVRPNYLRSPFEAAPPPGLAADVPLEPQELLTLPMDAPLGFTGPSSVIPREGQTSSHFVPLEDRWRVGMPEWDRYGLNHPPLDDYPFTLGPRARPLPSKRAQGRLPDHRPAHVFERER